MRRRSKYSGPYSALQHPLHLLVRYSHQLISYFAIRPYDLKMYALRRCSIKVYTRNGLFVFWACNDKHQLLDSIPFRIV